MESEICEGFICGLSRVLEAFEDVLVQNLIFDILWKYVGCKA